MKEDYSAENIIIKIVERIQRKMFNLDKAENDLTILSDIEMFYKKIEVMFDIKMDDKPKTLTEIINKIIREHK